MLVLLDRAFDATALLTEIAATGAQLLVRSKSTRHPAVLRHLPDGSYLSVLNGLAVRIVEARLTVRGADGSQVGDSYRLITTLLDHHRYPAPAVVRLYHERWEIETAYLALRHTMLAGHVLRSGDRPGLEQERLGAAGRLPAAAHGDGRRRSAPPGHRSRPGQLHHRPGSRPRPAHRRRRHPERTR
jgi:hypothetical protein